MNKLPQNNAQMPDYLKARKLPSSGIIIGMAGTKKLNKRVNTHTKVETVTIDAIKAELDFIDVQLKRRAGNVKAKNLSSFRLAEPYP